MEMKEDVFDIKYEPLAGAKLTNVLQIFAQNRFRISFRYLPKASYTLLLSSLISSFNVVEDIKYDKKIRETEIRHPPIFIIGHWRSGTTYLHNALSR